MGGLFFPGGHSDHENYQCRRRCTVRENVYIWLAAVFLLLTAPAFGQQYLATISGTVTDTSGAVIKGAEVSAVNSSTHFISPATTNDSGVYTIPFLTPGTYSVIVTAPGFQKQEQTSVVLNASAKALVDFKLQPGSVAQNVEVKADLNVLDTGTASLGQVIDSKEVAELPNIGRNPYIDATLTAGTYSDAYMQRSASQYTQPYSGVASQMQVGGLGNYHRLELNGMPNDAPERLSAVTYTNFVPSPEAVQEVNNQTLLYDAQYGHSDGAVVNTIIRTGQNQFHGAVYYILQNEDLNANTWQRNYQGLGRSVDRWQQPGFVVDGPVWLPKIYNGHDRTFFTFAYERIQTNTPNPYTGIVPTDKMRAGDFSEILTANGRQLYNPFSPVDSKGNRSQVFTNNDISAYVNPVAANLVKYFPEPTLPYSAIQTLGYNFVAKDDTNTDHYWSLIARIDHQITPSQKITGLFVRSLRNQRYAKEDWPTPAAPGYSHFRNNTGASLEWVSIFNPTLVLDSRAGFMYHPFSLTYYSANFDLASAGFPSSLVSQLPAKTFPGASFSGGANGYSSMTYAGGGQGQYSEATASSWMEVLSKSLWQHMLKGGIELYALRYNLNTPASSFGNFSYNTQFTQHNYLNSDKTSGDPMADFMLGYASGGSVAWNIAPAYQQMYWGAFVQDDWRVLPKLTLNLGLRWDYEAPMTERHNRMNAGFCATCVNPLQQQVSGLTLNGGLLFTSSNNRQPYSPDLNNWQPRIGVAYQATKDLVFRGGFGMIFLPTFDAPGNQGYSTTTGYIASNNSGQTPANSLSNPYPGGINVPSGSSLGLSTLIGQSISFLDPDKKSPKVYFGSASMELQLPGQTVMEVGYVGNASRGYEVSKGINALPAQYFSLGASALNAKVTNPMAGKIPNNSTLNGATIPYQYLLVPYPEFSGISEYGRNLGTTSFNSLQARLKKRFSHGFSFQANFMWAKEMNQTSYLNDQDDWDHPYRREASTPNRIFNGYFSYAPPTPFKTSRLSRALLGGWQVNGVLRWQNGTLISTPGGVYQLVASPRATHQTMQHFFNTCYIDLNGNRQNCNNDPFPAWQQRPAFTLNTAPIYMNGIRSWVHPLADASLFKKFTIHERLNCELRGEFFNVTNRVNWGFPNTSLTSSSFGVLGATQANDPRIGQVTARINF
jgi:hypothetical protein